MVEKKHTAGMTRRDLGALAKDGAKAALAVIATAGLMSDAEAQTKAPANVFDELSKYEFLDQNGKPANINALRTSLQNQFVTTTFGFENCETICPMVNQSLKALGSVVKKNNQKMTSIVIAVQPEIDGISQVARDKFMNRLKSFYQIPQDVVILYPAEKGKFTANSAKTQGLLARSFGSLASMSAPVQHSTEITLFKAGGQQIDKKNGMTSPDQFEKIWGKYFISQAQGKN